MAELKPFNNNEYEKLVISCETAIRSSVEESVRVVTRLQLSTYWEVGRYIVEYEQHGEKTAEYGQQLLANLSKDLTARLGKGYGKSNLYLMRKFYTLFPNGVSELDGLSWSHVIELLNISDDLERQFYINECIAEKWSVRFLKKQKDRALFLRIAAEKKDRDEVLKLAQNGIEIATPKDIVKDTYTLDFLGIDVSKEKLYEDVLEAKIIHNVKDFLIELGKGYIYVGEQYPIKVGSSTYKCDLVFYNRILKCFVLIDLKVNPVKHIDIGQMNMYMGYFAEEVNEPDDNPPVGIILARDKDELLVKYATYGMDNNLFVSKYELYLPDKKELKKLVDNIIDEDTEGKCLEN